MVTVAQLLAAGLDRDAIKYRRRVGRLHLLHRGVYAVGHRPRHHPGPHPRRPRRRPPPKAHTRALNEAQVHRLVTPAELTTLLTRFPGRRTARLTPERGATRSPLEDRFVRFLNHHHLPRPELNRTIAGHEVDAVYRAHKLVIELHSRQFHTTIHAFEKDRDRDADLLNAGFATLRITDHRLKHHPTKEAQRLRDIMRSRG